MSSGESPNAIAAHLPALDSSKSTQGWQVAHLLTGGASSGHSTNPQRPLEYQRDSAKDEVQYSLVVNMSRRSSFTVMHRLINPPGNRPVLLRILQLHDHLHSVRIKPPERPPGRVDPPPEARRLRRRKSPGSPFGEPPDDPPGRTQCLSPPGLDAKVRDGGSIHRRTRTRINFLSHNHNQGIAPNQKRSGRQEVVREQTKSRRIKPCH